MLDLFTMHSEHKIGIKCLSEADLGLGKSHQTHIGLYGEVLSYLPDHFYSEKGLLFNDDNFNLVTMFFDRITNPDGTTRSPKFRLGDANEVSLIGKIREIVKNNPSDSWYLLWFGIDNGSILSVLFKEKDKLFKLLKILGIVDSNNCKRVVSFSDTYFSSLVDVLQGWIYSIMQDSLKEMEKSTFSQRPFNRLELELNNIFDISDRFLAIYQLAISHCYHYLEEQKQLGTILGYELLSKTEEQDNSNIFLITKKNGESKTMILKATEFDVKQPFILGIDDLQLIYTAYPNSSIGIIRFFNVDNSGCMMQICNSLLRLVSQVLNPISVIIEASLPSNSPIMNFILGVVESKYPGHFSQVIKLPR
ncbi:MAG: hypothetical protein RBR15_00800 [Sphaerochaeta sp.]|nr:hypothetical protein [Sphaerochaeta sp.]